MAKAQSALEKNIEAENSTNPFGVPRALVLVVDDEESICTSLANVLSDEDFEAIVANSGEMALRMIEEHNPEIVFLDIWMPGCDGMETLQRIKELSPNTEVIMISGHATISNALEAMKRGAMDFIEKPFDIDSVILSATRALEKRWRSHSGDFSPVESNADTQAQGSALAYTHPGVLSRGLAGKNLQQRTIRDSVVLYGHCLHSGMKSGLVLEPLPANSGLQYSKMGHSKAVPVFVDNVESTELATTLRNGGMEAATIEHLMSALHAYGISNVLIKCNGEVPIFDGSAEQFCSVIDSVGIEEQGGDWFEVAVDKRYEYRPENPRGDELISIEPCDSLKVTYELNYPAPIGQQTFSFDFSGVDSFKEAIAPARTFGFMKDAERLQRAGLAAGARLDNFLLIGNDDVVNTELRFADEPVRHKILDILGDLYLLGRPLRGHIKARMTGHSDNIGLLRLIRKDI